MHLYELTTQMRGLQHLIEDGEMDPQTLQDTLDGLTGDIQAKAEGLLAYVGNLQGDVDAIDDAVKRLQERKALIVRKQESLREYLRYNMQAAGMTKISCPLFSVTLVKPRPMCLIDDLDRIPEKFKKTVTTPVKADILAALKAGEDVPGASLGETQPGLLIR